MSTTTSVLVAGGGIAGLTLAYDLTRSGVDCVVVESDHRPGGLIHTERRDGFVLDAGPDAFLLAKPDARELCEELGVGGEIVSTNPDLRRVYVLSRGRLRALPEGMRLTVPTRFWPLLRSDFFSLGGKIRLACEPLVPAKRNGREESIAEFVARRFGREALERVGEPLLAGIHCGDATRLSMSRLFPRLVELEQRYGSVTRGMRAAGEAGESVFASLASGMGRLVERLVERVSEGSVWLGSEAVGLERSPEGFETRLATGETVRSRAVALALPLPVSARLVRGPLPGAADAIDRIPFASTAVAFLGFRREDVSHPLDGYGFVVPANERSRLLAVTFVTTKLPDRAPPGVVLLRCFLGGRKEPRAHAERDDVLVDRALGELGSILGVSGRPLLSRVVRWPERTPQVELGHDAILNAIDASLSGWPGLFLLGNGLTGVGIPDSIRAARRTGDAIRRFLRREETAPGAVSTA